MLCILDATTHDSVCRLERVEREAIAWTARHAHSDNLWKKKKYVCIV